MNKKVFSLVLCIGISTAFVPNLHAHKDKIKKKKVVKGAIKTAIGMPFFLIAFKKRITKKGFGVTIYNEKTPMLRRVFCGILGGLFIYSGVSDIAEGLDL